MGLPGVLARQILLPVARRVRLLRSAAAFIDDQLGRHGYERLREQFIRNGRGSTWTEEIRADLVCRFEAIHRHVPIQSSASDGLIVAEAALSMSAAGDLIECGAFSGGSTAKLSILAHLLRRRLVVFDSFEGLPPVAPEEATDYHARQSAPCTWKAGACRASLEDVQANVAGYGEPSACVFVRGWFSDTLTTAHLPEQVALAYTDVVLPSSARVCLAALWPRLSDGGVYFSRDLALTNAWTAMADPTWWRETLGQPRPVILGAGFGLSDASPYLGFLVKGADPPGAYLDRLRMFKPSAGVPA